MQISWNVSLNSVRIFARVAELQSLKRAAQDFCVTPGAVSRQIRSLELSMGVTLFERSNNMIRLTPAGETFYRHCHSPLNQLDRSIAFAMDERRELSILASTTMAMRWLIPRLDGFRRHSPDIAVKIETWNGSFDDCPTTHDVSLGYAPADVRVRSEDILFEDVCRPYLAPRLLSGARNWADLIQFPALQGTDSNWDWRLWLEMTGKTSTELQLGDQFDLDDAAIRAAISGMGMVLASEVLVRDDVETGRLCALPDSPAVLLGHYTMKVSIPTSKAAVRFSKWLRNAH